jgi:hypothetical protein
VSKGRLALPCAVGNYPDGGSEDCISLSEIHDCFGCQRLYFGTCLWHRALMAALIKHVFLRMYRWASLPWLLCQVGAIVVEIDVTRD